MNPREWSDKLLEMIEDGLLDKDNVIMAMVKYLSDDDVERILELNEWLDLHD